MPAAYSYDLRRKAIVGFLENVDKTASINEIRTKVLEFLVANGECSKKCVKPHF